LMGDYVGNDGHKYFIDKFIQLNREKYQVIYMNIRTGNIDYNVSQWEFNNITSNNIKNASK